MKQSRSSEEKESFNCITHPLFTSFRKLSRPSVGMDNCAMKRWRAWMVYMVLSDISPLFTQLQTHISHTNTQKVSRTDFSNFKTTGYQKTIDVPLSPTILQKLASPWWEMSDVSHTLKDKAEHRYWLMPRYSIYGTHTHTQKKTMADSEMPPCDFLEELIYSI